MTWGSNLVSVILSLLIWSIRMLEITSKISLSSSYGGAVINIYLCPHSHPFSVP